MGSTIYRKCKYCGHVTLNSDFCDQCGEIINISLRRKTRQKKINNRTISDSSTNKVTDFFENAKSHRFLAIRVLAKIFYSVWVLGIAIAGTIAIIILYISA